VASGLIIRWIGPQQIEDAALPSDLRAQIFRACAACHALAADGGNRAGPTLHGLFGCSIASVPGYAYSEALRRRHVVWTPETVARLFEVGPATFLPGTKMLEQVLARPEDRAALVGFLAEATR
jgi:cytochrome c